MPRILNMLYSHRRKSLGGEQRELWDTQGVPMQGPKSYRALPFLCKNPVSGANFCPRNMLHENQLVEFMRR